MVIRDHEETVVTAKELGVSPPDDATAVDRALSVTQLDQRLEIVDDPDSVAA